MRTVWLHRTGRPQLLVFFAGWGMDHRPFRSLASTRYDVCVCFDYRDLTLDEELRSVCSDAGDVTVIAWSFGCAAAANILAQGLTSRLRAVIAINGTVTPEDDDVGIPARWLDATANNLDARSWQKFVRRMCWDPIARDAFERNAPQRNLAELADELLMLRKLSTPEHCPFTQALIGRQDKIIAPANQQRGWERFSIPITWLDAPHFPFHLWATWEQVMTAGAASNNAPNKNETIP